MPRDCYIAMRIGTLCFPPAHPQPDGRSARLFGRQRDGRVPAGSERDEFHAAAACEHEAGARTGRQVPPRLGRVSRVQTGMSHVSHVSVFV